MMPARSIQIGRYEMSRNREVASRLLEFIADAQQKASSVGFETQVGQPSSWRTPLEQLYERCLAELTDEERDALDSMIVKMRRPLAQPTPR
jgi:hypothetical protein